MKRKREKKSEQGIREQFAKEQGKKSKRTIKNTGKETKLNWTNTQDPNVRINPNYLTHSSLCVNLHIFRKS